MLQGGAAIKGVSDDYFELAKNDVADPFDSG